MIFKRPIGLVARLRETPPTSPTRLCEGIATLKHRISSTGGKVVAASSHTLIYKATDRSQY
jgi:hypothetical protein